MPTNAKGLGAGDTEALEKIVPAGKLNDPSITKATRNSQAFPVSGYSLDKWLTMCDGLHEIRFTVPGLPTAWARARTAGKIHFTPQPQCQRMAIVSQIASDAMAGRPPLAGPVALHIIACWPWPKSLSERKRKAVGAHLRTSRPDSDNVAKLLADSLNGICWLDDAQVVELHVSKQYGLTAATFVTVTSILPEVAS